MESYYDESRSRTVIFNTASSQDEYDEEGFLAEYESEGAGRQHHAIMDYCRAVSEYQEFSASSVPACERLSIRRKTGIQLVKDTVPKPPGSVPEVRLPSWNRLGMEKKIPLYPAANRSIIFSRGSVGEELHRKQKQYVNDDPYNQERVLTGSYNALHDPYAQNYFAKPSVKKQLIRQGLVTPTGQVICTLTEFNQFRSYLNSTVYNEDVNTSLEKYNLQIKVCMEQTKKIKKEESTTVGKDFERQRKAELVRNRTQKLAYDNMKRFKERERVKEERMMRWKMLEEQKRLDRKMRAAEKEQSRLMILENIQQRDYETRIQKMQIIEAKEKAALFRQYSECGMANIRREKQNSTWIEMKCDFQEEQEVKEELMELCLRRDVVRKAELRQRRIEQRRASLPHFVEAKRRHQEKLGILVRYFFNKWVRTTQRRRHSHPDTSHQSLFPVTSKMEITVDELKDEAGVEISRKPDKFGDVILTVVDATRDGTHTDDEFDDGDRGHGKGDSPPTPQPPETPESDETEIQDYEETSPPVTPEMDAAGSKENRRLKKNDLEQLMDDGLVDNATEQYAQDLVDGTLDHLFSEARVKCQDLLREAHLCGLASKKKLEMKQARDTSEYLDRNQTQSMSSTGTDSVDTLFVRGKSDSPNRKSSRARNSVEAWMQKNRNLNRTKTAKVPEAVPQKHPDESVPLQAMHPQDRGLPRSIFQGQCEHMTLQQFYYRGLERVGTSYSTDSFLSPVSSARRSPDTGRSQRSKSSSSAHTPKVSRLRPGTRRRPISPDSEPGEGQEISEAGDVRRPGTAGQPETTTDYPPEIARRPSTSGQIQMAEEHDIDVHQRSSSEAMVRPESSQPLETARSDKSSDSSESSSAASLKLPERSKSVEAIREEYLKQRSRLNRSSSPSFDYSSDEFLNLHTDEEDEGNSVLYQIAQEARALSRTESLTSLSSFPMASEIAQSIHSASQGKDDMECVMTKRNMFGSMESYHNFTDVVYQEMTLIAQNKTLVEELMDTLTTEEDVTLFRNDFFKRLLTTCVSEDDIRLVRGLYKGKRIPSSSYHTKGRNLPFSKAQSALAIGTKYSSRGIKETHSGPSVIVSKKKLGFTPKKIGPKRFTAAERPREEFREDRKMKGDTMDLLEADDEDESPRKERYNETYVDTTATTSEAETTPRKYSSICEPNLKTTENEGIIAQESLSDHSNTSEKSYVTLSPSSSCEDRDIPAPLELRRMPRLNLKKLNNVRIMKTSFPARSHHGDGIPDGQFHHKIPGPRLTAAYSKFGSGAPTARSDKNFAVHVTMKPRQTAPIPARPMSRYSNGRVISQHSVNSPRPPTRGKHRDQYERVSSVPKLPELPGVRESMVTPPERRPTPRGNVKLPRLVPPPETLVTVIAMRPNKGRTITKRHTRRAVASERGSAPRRPPPLQSSARPAKSNPLNSSRFIANPNLGVVPSLMLRNALSESDVLYIPHMETIDEILKLIRTIVVYKITHQVLIVVSSGRIKETHFSDRMLSNIEKVAIKSIIKISLPLAEMMEQRSFPQLQIRELTLSSYRARLQQLADGISSLIVASLGNNNGTVEV